MSIPTHLQSTVDLLTRAYGHRISEQEYFALLAFLGEHMCEENVGLAVAFQFGRNQYDVINDLAKVQSVRVPAIEDIELVRSRLDKVGLAEWLLED